VDRRTVQKRSVARQDPVRATIAAAGTETTGLSNPGVCYVINTHESFNRILTVNEQIAGPSVNPSAGSFIQDLMPLLTNYDFMKMSINIDQFSYVEKLATLTQLYLELKLPLHDALRAAEADL
jgi:hypothetical protein